MKKRHLITLAIIAGISSCTSPIPQQNTDSGTRSSEPRDTANVDINAEPAEWENAINVDFTFGGTTTD